MRSLDKIIAYFVDRHLLTNLMFAVVLIGGIYAWQNTSKEELPDIEFDRCRVSAGYPGATAAEVEHFVTKPLEDAVKGIDGVYRVESVSSDGSTSIGIDFEQGYPDLDEAVMEVRNAVLDVKLPDDVRDEPNVRIWKTTKKAIIDIALYDPKHHLLDTESRKRLQQYAYNMGEQLLNLPHINSVDKSAYLQEEIRIMVHPDRLRKYNIPFSNVKREVANNHIRQPAGSIETKYDPKVTLLSELDTVDKLNDLIIQGGFEGQVIKLRQVADVTLDFEKNKSIMKVNGHEAIMLRTVKNSSYGILEALKAVNIQLDIFRKHNLQGTGIELVTLDDESVDLRNRLTLVVANGAIGFVLILAMLFIFLDVRSGIWVAMGIPFTLCFSMIFASALGYTINNVTLAAVIIVLGMIVDDAIVVSENIGRLRAEGMNSRESAIKGTAFVFTPIVASILTTCIAFVPLFFFKARHGKMLTFIPPIIFLMLGASLFESLIILPGHLNLNFTLPWKRPASADNAKKRVHWFGKFEESYGVFLNKLLPFKWIILPIFLLLFIFSWHILTTKMSFVMFPNEETREIVLTGTAEETADRYETAQITKQVDDIISPYIGKEVIGFRTRIARSRRGRTVTENKFRMLIEIVPKDKRKKSADQLLNEWKEHFADITGLVELKIAKSRWGHSSGSPIELIVQENNDEIRKKVAVELADAMKLNPALENVEIEQPIDNPEYKISLKREKIKRLSINSSDVSSTLRAALQGTVIYELPKGDEEIDVILTVIDDAKTDIDNILDIPIENSGDYLVPLRDIVEVKKTVTPSSIERKDSKRITTIFADIKDSVELTPIEIAETIENIEFPKILSRYPTVLLNFEGEVKDTRESQGDFTNAILMAVILIYIILVLLFNSLSKPLIIMLAIPLGMIGIILAFWLHGKVLYGLFATIGAIGLAGVVVNDSIIMLVKLERNYDDTKEKTLSSEQISSIAKTRLRAVILTTVTTVAGLLPTAYGFTGYDAMLAEMMLAITWGLLFGTFITLILVPCVYSFSKDLSYQKRKLMSRLS